MIAITDSELYQKEQRLLFLSKKRDEFLKKWDFATTSKEQDVLYEEYMPLEDEFRSLRKKLYELKSRQKPEVKERIKEYKQRPEVKEKKKEYMQEYHQRPGAKAYRKEYRQRPEVKEQKRKDVKVAYYVNEILSQHKLLFPNATMTKEELKKAKTELRNHIRFFLFIYIPLVSKIRRKYG